MISLFKKHWLARQARFQAASPTSSDTRGYTLQTVIVSAILLSTAVLASVVLYRAITTNTDVRAFADLTGDNAPTRPHGFSVDHYFDDPDEDGSLIPAARVRWSPPLYTGQPQLAGSPSLLNYEATYNCEDSGRYDEDVEDIPLGEVTAADGMIEEQLMEPEFDLAGDLVQAEEILGDEFVVGMGAQRGHCVVSVRAWTCPDISPENPLCDEGQRIYGLAEEFRFVLSTLSSAPRNVEINSTDNFLLVSWETPENIALTQASITSGNNLFYKVEWWERGAIGTMPNLDVPADMKKCTFNNFYPILTMRNMVYDIRITTQIFNTDADIENAEKMIESMNGNQCPTDDDLLNDVLSDQIMMNLDLDPDADSPFIEFYDLTAVTLELPEIPSNLNIALADSEPSSYDATQIIQNPIYQDGRILERVDWTLSWDRSDNVDSYILEWARADLNESIESQVISNPETGMPKIILSLDNGVSYNFSLRARNSVGVSEPLEVCTTVATRHRYLSPSVSSFTADEEIKIIISKPSQARYCQLESFCINDTCMPPSLMSSSQYKIRIHSDDDNPSDPNDAECAENPPAFPNATCTNDDIVICVSAPDHTELVRELILLSSLVESEIIQGDDTSFVVEVIAGNNCSASTKIMNNLISPYASLPVTTTVSTMGGSFNAIEGSVIVNFDQVTSMWTIMWSPPADIGALDFYVVDLELEGLAGGNPTPPASKIFALDKTIAEQNFDFDHDGDSSTQDVQIICTVSPAVSCSFPNMPNPNNNIQLTATVRAFYFGGVSEPRTGSQSEP